METQGITRTVVSTNTQEVSTAEFNGWNLNFTVTTGGGVSVSVSGSKGEHTVFASKNEDGYINVGFSQGAIDTDLYLALVDELQNI